MKAGRVIVPRKTQTWTPRRGNKMMYPPSTPELRPSAEAGHHGTLIKVGGYEYVAETSEDAAQ
jgi:hypothetical protein